MYVLARSCSIETFAPQACASDAAAATDARGPGFDDEDSEGGGASWQPSGCVLDLMELSRAGKNADARAGAAEFRQSHATKSVSSGRAWIAQPHQFALQRSTYERLHAYQRTGVAWMAELHRSGHGGILADEMGLGKTVQVCSFLSGLRRAGGSHALVLMPVTLMQQWKAELQEWCPEWPVYLYHGSAAQRARALSSVLQPRGGVLLTSYAVFSNNDEILRQVELLDASAESAQKASMDNASSALKRRAPIECHDSEPQPEESAKQKAKKRRRKVDAVTAAATQEGVVEVEDEDVIPAGFQRTSRDLSKPWDVVICDEAHKLKNISTLLGKSVRGLAAQCRILLTGTPVQNSLQDLWALLDFAQPGLLGNHATFVKHFSDPINHGSVRGASSYAVGLKKHLSEELWRLVSPHVLRRTKLDVGLLADGESGDAAAEGMRDTVPHLAETVGKDESIDAADVKALPRKSETIVWLMPTEEQVVAYRKVLEKSEIVREASCKAKLGIDVFQAIGLLKRLCNHPILAAPSSQKASWAELLARAGGVSREGVQGDDSLGDDTARGYMDTAEVAEAVPPADHGMEELLAHVPRDTEELLQASAKLRCLAKLLPALAQLGHRTLVFSQGAKMFDLIEICILKRLGIGYLRMDGRSSVTARAEAVARFQTEREQIKFMLLTTSVGGCGLNLTGADRVVIIDPAWNPAMDAQAVDRVFRIGQQREVRVYRLIMSGLIEDKMFRLQVFKMGLMKTALEVKPQQHYFTSREIRGLFDWTEPSEGETRKLLIDAHGDEQEHAVKQHAAEDGAEDGWLEAGPVLGLSNFSALFSTLLEDKASDVHCAQIAEMKQKLAVADEKVQQVAETQGAAEQQLDLSKKVFKEAAQHILKAATERSKADDTLAEKRAELSKLKRKQAAAEQRLKKAKQAQLDADRDKAVAEKAKQEADAAAAAATEAASEARGALLAAEETLPEAVDAVRQVLATVDSSGRAAGTGFVDAAVVGLKVTQRAFEQVTSSLDKVNSTQAELQRAGDKLMEAEVALAGAEAKLERQGSADVDDVASCKRVRGESEAAQQKAQQCAELAQQSASLRIAEFLEAGLAFVASFQKSRARSSVKGSQVELAKKQASLAFQRLSAAWHATRTAQVAWLEASMLCREPSKRAVLAAAACEEAEDAFREVDAALQTATAEEEACRTKRSAREADALATQAALNSALASESDWRRKQEECRANLGAAHLELLKSRAAQHDAESQRASLYAWCAQEENLHLQMESAQKGKVTEAVQALRAEQYDANQVEEAYQAKKKQRVEVVAGTPPVQ